MKNIISVISIAQVHSIMLPFVHFLPTHSFVLKALIYGGLMPKMGISILCHLLAVSSWEDPLASLNLSFLICEIALLPTSQAKKIQPDHRSYSSGKLEFFLSLFLIIAMPPKVIQNRDRKLKTGQNEKWRCQLIIFKINRVSWIEKSINNQYKFHLD